MKYEFDKPQPKGRNVTLDPFSNDEKLVRIQNFTFPSLIA